MRVWALPKDPGAWPIWSKGIAAACDVSGPAEYRLLPTERPQDAAFFARNFAGASGLVWVRLGTVARDGIACDLDGFVAGALPTITRPFILVTTDGDATSPRDFWPPTVAALLGSPHLLAWYTQNHDGSCAPRVRPFPIGLDLHTSRLGWTTDRRLEVLSRLRERRRPAGAQPLRVFSDADVTPNSADRRAAIVSLSGCRHVRKLYSRVGQGTIWRAYASHPFVVSAHGNGLDCHRTWEVLLLGSIPIVRRSSLDPLYEGLPVAIVDDWDEVRDLKRLAALRAELAPLTAREHVWPRLTAAAWLAPLRAQLGRASKPEAA
jgi:hypothetical protein